MIQINNLINDLVQVRTQSPLVHNITNFVVMNNTANALLALGASPVMAHSLEEVEDMTRIASALVINIGTLSPEWVAAMTAAGKAAQSKGIPVVFDPVGAGATECCPTIIRGNASEIMALSRSDRKTKGVDSTDASDAALDAAKEVALESGAVVVISGETDYITNGDSTEAVQNGNPMMARVTGMGCSATAVVAAFAAVNPDPLVASLHGMAIMGIAGEIAASQSKGNGSLQVHFLDELYCLDAETIRNHIRL